MINTKEYYKYNQYTKQNVRHTAIFKAVEILTSKREQSCCVERNYVRKIYDYFIRSEDISQNKKEAEKINVSYITNWEDCTTPMCVPKNRKIWWFVI